MYYCTTTVLLLYYHCKELISQPNPRAAAHPRSTPNPSAPQFPSNLIKATQILSQPTQRRPRTHTIQAKSFGRGGGGSTKRAATLTWSHQTYDGVRLETNKQPNWDLKAAEHPADSPTCVRAGRIMHFSIVASDTRVSHE